MLHEAQEKAQEEAQSNDGPTRRALVKWLAASAALAASGCSRPPRERIYSTAHAPELEVNGAPLYYASASVRGGFAHGVLIATQQGRPVKVEGNRQHPASLGATDAAEQAAILQLWDPDRSQTPWERVTATRARPATWVQFQAAWRANALRRPDAAGAMTPVVPGAGADADTNAVAGGSSAARLHVLTGRFTSPLLAAQLAALFDANPGARWHSHEAVDDAAAREAAQTAFGRALRPVWHLDRADTVVSLGVDPFSGRPDAVRNAADWARSRAEAVAGGRTPARAIAFETAPSLFGARADERFALTPPHIEFVLWQAAAQAAPELLADSHPPKTSAQPDVSMHRRTDPLQARLSADPHAAVVRLATLLNDRSGRTLLCAGETLSAASQALVHRLNHRLDQRRQAFAQPASSADGACCELIASPDVHPALPPPASLGSLVSAIQAGEVDRLVILGGNPVYAAPAALGFAEAVARVPFSVHLSLYRDETSERCTWHLPSGHDFEQWSDARAFDGSVTLIQPAIAPLYDTRSVHELLALLMPAAAGRAQADGHALLQAHWRAHRRPPTGSERDIGRDSSRRSERGLADAADTTADAGASADADFDRFWDDSLRAGVVAGSRSTPVGLSATGLAPIGAGATASPLAEPVGFAAGPDAVAAPLWAVFPPDASVSDGSLANNGWLQELPRPFTKITWGNALQIGPGTARALGLVTGDIVHVRRVESRAAAAPVSPAAAPSSLAPDNTFAQSQVEAPVWVQTGHAEGAATLPMGYGRRAAGRVGNGVGFDTAALRSADAAPVAVEIERTGRRHAFALTQVEMPQHGRDLARTMRLASLREASVEPPAAPSLYPKIDAGETAWAMVIDLDACTGCNACTIACQSENNIPVVGADEVRNGRAMHWIRVDNHLDAEGGAISQPVPCMHCENAPCELVCPVGATVHDSEGLNVQVYNRCIGTRFCSNNCPYKVRRFNFRQYSDVSTETLKLMRNPDVTVRSRGVMEKCNYCMHRLSRARRETQKIGGPLPTDEVVTACQASCPTGAIHFGNLSDPASDVARQRGSPRHYAMLEELNTRPRTTYLARVGEPRDTDGDDR